MDTTKPRESATDAIRFWEPLGLFYNAVLAAIVLIHFAVSYPASKASAACQQLICFAIACNITFCAFIARSMAACG